MLAWGRWRSSNELRSLRQQRTVKLDGFPVERAEFVGFAEVLLAEGSEFIGGSSVLRALGAFEIRPPTGADALGGQLLFGDAKEVFAFKLRGIRAAMASALARCASPGSLPPTFAKAPAGKPTPCVLGSAALIPRPQAARLALFALRRA